MRQFIFLLLLSSVAVAQENIKLDTSNLWISVPATLILIGVVIWSIRQEGDIKANKKANDELGKAFDEYKLLQAKLIDNLYTKHDSLNSEIAGRILDTNKSLSKLEGKIDTLISLQKK